MKPKHLLLVVSVFLFAMNLEAAEVTRRFTVGSSPMLILEVDPARLFIEAGDSNIIEVKAGLTPEFYTISAEQEGSKVTVSLETKGTLGLIIQKLQLDEVDLRVKVPPECDVVLVTRTGRLEVRGVGGEIRSHSGSKIGQIVRWIFRTGRSEGDGQSS